jgi:hypothetical protein
VRNDEFGHGNLFCYEDMICVTRICFVLRVFVLCYEYLFCVTSICFVYEDLDLLRDLDLFTNSLELVLCLEREAV